MSTGQSVKVPTSRAGRDALHTLNTLFKDCGMSPAEQKRFDGARRSHYNGYWSRQALRAGK